MRFWMFIRRGCWLKMVVKYWFKRGSIFVEGNDLKKKFRSFNIGFVYNKWEKFIFIWIVSVFVLIDMKMTVICLFLLDVFGDDFSFFVIVNEKVCSVLMIIGLIFYIFI